MISISRKLINEDINIGDEFKIESCDIAISGKVTGVMFSFDLKTKQSKLIEFYFESIERNK